MPDVSGDELESVTDRGRGDLEVGVRKSAAFARQFCLDLAKNARHGNVVGKNSDCRQDSRVDVVKMPFTIYRAERPLVKLANDNCAGELFGAGNASEPAEIAGCRSSLKNLRDGVSVEEKGHPSSVELCRRPWTGATQTRNRFDEFLGSFPSTRQACETPGR